MQAPVPYLNRALAEEQLGVDADEHNEHQEAQVQYSGAVKASLCCVCINAVAHGITFDTCNLQSCLQVAVCAKVQYVQIAVCTTCIACTVE